MLRAVVAGLGIGMAHVAGYLKSSHAELAGVCDLMPARTKKAGGTFEAGSMLCLKPLLEPPHMETSPLGKRWEEIGVRVYGSLKEVAADRSVDIVSLCTPDYLHAEHAELMLRSGKHLLLEKPLDITLEKAARYRTLAEGSGVKFCVGYEFRVNPAVKKLKSLAGSGELGEVRGFSLHHHRAPFRTDKWNGWIQKKACSGGLVVEETCHWFDLARFIPSLEIETVHCVTDGRIPGDSDFEDIAYINGTYGNGGVFQIAHTLTGFDFSLIIQLHGTEGVAWCGLKEGKYSSFDNGCAGYFGIVSHGKPGIDPQDAAVETWNEEATEPFNIEAMVREFARAVACGEEAAATYEDGYRSLAASLAALKSAENGTAEKI